ncbi:MAG TPA: GNAT family N-acetyltransferase [Arenicellales bacterium]|nr:GNAT family N-acetyltransferase [Arenicellales bacterium]
MNDIHYRPMRIADHAQLLALMRRTPGIRVRSADELGPVRRYLERNPGASFVAEGEGELVGCAMAGHDGRRGYLQHVIVAAGFRRRGIGRNLVARCVEALNRAGIEKFHLDVMAGNEEVAPFWEQLGWFRRDDLVRYSLITSADSNA